MMTNLITVRDYLRLIFRRKFALLPPVFLALVAIIPLWILVPTRYRAEALIKRQEPGMVRDATGAKMRSVGTSLKTLRVEILTWDNLDRVIRQLKMDRSLRTPADWQRQYKRLREDISIRLLARGNSTDLIEISAIADTPESAMEITNAIADNYVEASKRSGRLDSENAVDFLRQRARDTLEKLQAVEHKLALFREQHLSTVPEVRQALVEKIAALKTQMASKRYQIAALTTRLEQVVKRLKDTPKTVVHDAQVEDNPEYVKLADEIKDRKEMLDRALSLTYEEEHPDMVALRKEIKRLEEELAQIEATVTAEVKKESPNPFYEAYLQERISLGQDIKTAESMIVKIQADVAAHELQAGKIVKKEKSWNDLQRARAEYESTYSRYSGRLEAAETLFDVATSRFGTQVDMKQRALKPEFPYQRQRIVLAFACIGGGIAVGVALMFVVEFCDHSFRGIEDAADFLNMPVLGCITMITTPEELAQRHRRKVLTLVCILTTIVFLVGGLALWEHLEPGALRMLFEATRAYLR